MKASKIGILFNTEIFMKLVLLMVRNGIEIRLKSIDRRKLKTIISKIQNNWGDPKDQSIQRSNEENAIEYGIEEFYKILQEMGE